MVERVSFLKWALEDLITFGQAVHSDAPHEQDQLVEEAVQSTFLGTFVRNKNRKDFVWFLHGEKIVGFAIPRKDSDGRYRTGAIFVTAAFRKKGVAGAFVKGYFSSKKGRAFIEPDNTASIALYVSVGFRKSGKAIRDEEITLDEYLKD